MIGKIRNIQDSWLMKLILILTALSFMSLFGVSGYYATAAHNKPVIRVDDIEISQNQILNELNNELQKAKSLFGDNLDVNENIRNAILQGLIQKKLSDAILEKTSQDNNVHISDELIMKIIASQPEFMDQTGKFNAQIMRRILASVGMSEQEYVQSLRRDVAKIHLVYNVVDGISIPDFMAEYYYKLANQKKIFKYINIDPDKMKIDRKISQDEIEQYYNDFATKLSSIITILPHALLNRRIGMFLLSVFLTKMRQKNQSFRKRISKLIMKRTSNNLKFPRAEISCRCVLQIKPKRTRLMPN